MLGLFSKKNIDNFLNTDVHSHLIPGIDDGVQSNEHAIDIIKGLNSIGISRIIATPHIMMDYYPNSPEIINARLEKLKTLVKQQGIDVKIEAAAEYMMDEHFVEKLDQGEKLMSFGDSYLLVELPFINKPIFLEEVFFKIKSLGYQPILAHPERYIYFQENFANLKALVETGVMLQINLISLMGYYSKKAKKLAEYLIDNNLIHFIGSDIHNAKHLEAYKKALSTKYFEKCRQLFLYNNTL